MFSCAPAVLPQLSRLLAHMTLRKCYKTFIKEAMILTCHMPSPVCVIFSADNVFLSFGCSIFGGVCRITNSLNITDDPRLFVDVGGLNKLELAEFC